MSIRIKERKVAQKEIASLSPLAHPTRKPIGHTRSQNSPSRESHDTPCCPSQKNRQKLPFASMLLLCQHSHYVSANSKPLLYLFRVYDILYFTFLIIFFCSLILDVPCLYHQPTAKLPISLALLPPRSSNSLLRNSLRSRRASSPRRVPPALFFHSL